MVSRRGVLAGAGLVSVLVIGGVVWRASDKGVFSIGQGPAYEPWQTWRTDPAEGPLAIVRAGILAANPHNTQPWLFQVSEQAVALYADTRRHLGSFDPFLREMHIGLGCALENMILAATANGYIPQISYTGGMLGPIPEAPEPRLVARIGLAPGEGQPDALYQVIARRHTNRGPYERNRPVPGDALEAMARMDDDDIRLLMFTEEPQRSRFAEAVVAATESIVADHEMVSDSQRWFRSTREEVAKHRDGPTLDAVGLSPLITALAKVLPPPSAERGHQLWLEATREVHVATAPAFGFLAVRNLDDRAHALRAGRRWQRLHLYATARGLAMHPINQPVELVDRERQLGRAPDAARRLAALTGSAAWKPTFAFRMGYPVRDAALSPRRALEDVVL